MTGDGGLARIQQRLRAIPDKVHDALKAPLERSGEDIVKMMKSLVPEDSGDLRDSITVTTAGNMTPPYSQPGGSIVVWENSIMVTVGNADVRYPHLVEYGTAKAPAQPFFWPAYHLTKRKIRSRIKRAIGKAVRDNWGKS